jgi:DNA processing protein
LRYSREQGCLAWLSHGLISGKHLASLLAQYGSAEAVYDAFMQDHGASIRDLMSPYSLSLLREHSSREQMHDMLVTMQKWDIGVISMKDAEYPGALRNIAIPPQVLFYQGNLAAMQGKCITVVGSRNATNAGISATHSVCRELSNAGVCIVSGLAVGIDTAAHKGCLDGASPTIGVASCGLNVPYPSDSVPLKERILSQNGLLLSEYPPDMRSSKYVFSARNRILAGLSSGVVLMEAMIRSGSMLTVQHALEQGKDVFAYPGIPGTTHSEGTHQLLREGAVFFTSARDILEDMGWADDLPEKPQRAERKHVVPKSEPPPKTPAKKRRKPEASEPAKTALEPVEEQAKPTMPLPPMNDEQKAVYEALSGGEMSFDQLAAQTKLNAPQLMSSLTMLQILGVIKALPGKSYCLVETN